MRFSKILLLTLLIAAVMFACPFVGRGLGIDIALAQEEGSSGAYTVDFHQGDAVYSIPGASRILLSDLIEKLGVYDGGELLRIAEVESAQFSNETYVSVERIEPQSNGEGDFLLTSLAPFSTDETLTLLLVGGRRLDIRVTDANFTVNVWPTGVGNSVTANKITGESITATTKDSGYNNNTITATAGSGYAFDHWELDGQRVTSVTGNSIGGGSLYIGNARTLTAVFNTNVITLQFVATEGGHVLNGDRIYTLDDYIQINNTVQAVEEPGYEFKGWYYPNGELYIIERHMRVHMDRITQSTVLTARFERITHVNVYYQTNQVRATLTRDTEYVDIDVGAQGCVATAKPGYTFISWVNEDGTTVWLTPDFTPEGPYLYEGATYTAVFEPDVYENILLMDVYNEHGDDVPGYIKSDTYNNAVHHKVVSMYVREDGTLPADLTAVAYEDYVFDHWELNGEELSYGETIPAGTLIDPDALWGGRNYLIACYEPNLNPVTHTIYYEVDPADWGTLSRTQDTWVGGHVEQIVGSNAQSVNNAQYAFAGWIERTDDPNVVLPVRGTNDPRLIPTGDEIRDRAIYTAVFRKITGQSGIVGYNMNIRDTPVTWTGPKDLAMTSGVGAIMYYDTKGGQYYATGDRFRLSQAIPLAEGYKFLGWFEKDRPQTSVTLPNGQRVTYPQVDARLLPPGYNDELVFRFDGQGGGRYTVEAIWAKIDAESKRLPYDGNQHLLEGRALIDKGTLNEDERYDQEIDAILAEDGYELGNVKYQLIAVDGVPVANQPQTDSFARTLPGLYTVKVTAEGEFLGQPFLLEKTITLEIYPAKIIIIKNWVDDDNVTGNRAPELDVSLNRGYVAGAEPMEDLTPDQVAGYPTAPPVWTKEGNTWEEEYELALVRPPEYDETDQDSGYYPYLAEEVVPKGYAFAGMSRELSLDRLTTTITFTNEIQKTSLTVNKLDPDGKTMEGARFTARMVKNIYGETPPQTIESVFEAGTHSEALPNGYYILEETRPPEGATGLSEPIYFTVFNGAGYEESEKGLHLTNEDWTAPKTYEGVTLSGSGEIYVMSVENDWLEITTTIPGTKELRGRDLKDTDVFTFRLEPAADDVGTTYPGLDGDAEICVVNGADGRFEFELKYTRADWNAYKGDGDTATFTYKVTEIAPDSADDDRFDAGTNIVYSDQVFWVRVTIGLDENGVLAILDQKVYDADPDEAGRQQQTPDQGMLVRDSDRML